MKKIFYWVIAATLICGTSVLTSCTENADDPVDPEPVVSPERQAFEDALSVTLQKSAEQIRFDAIKQSLTILIILLGGFAAAALPALGFLLLAPPLPGSVWMLLFALAGFLGALLLRLALRRRGETLFMEL